MALNQKEVQEAKSTFSLYDVDGSGKMDAFYLGRALRALNLAPTLKFLLELGGSRTREEKFLSEEEFISIYKEARHIAQSSTISGVVMNLKSSLPNRRPSFSEIEEQQKAAEAAAEASLKPRHQTAFLSMKTKGLIADMAKRQVKV